MKATPRTSAARTIGLALAGLVAAGASPLSGRQVDPGVEELLRGRVAALREGLEVRAAGDRLWSRQALPTFYEERGFRPAWVQSAEGGARLTALLAALRVASDHGLDSKDYHEASLDELSREFLAGGVSSMRLVDLELLASDAFMVLGSHLLHGRVNPETIDPEWLANRRNAAFHVVLSGAIERDDIAETLLGLAPQQPRYQAMVEAAVRLRRIATDGGWPVLAEGPRMEVGVDDPRVTELRTRLRASGDLRPTDPVTRGFDAELEAAVRAFQVRHGLDVDGVVGPATLAALNVSAGDRARQIEINLERWRWLPADLGQRHIEVNIAAFEAKVVESGLTVRAHRAVVGRQYRETPMFSGSMTYLVLSPYWHVPPTIAAVDKLPQIKRDPGVIAAQRMTLLDQRSNERVDPASVDWASLTGPDFNRRYRLRQDPGPTNALGSVKFMFPNRHNVYLHDTPTRELFDRTTRNFSSGCIRIERPLDLAEFLLADQPGWPRGRIDTASSGATEVTVRLTNAVPVHLLYWTAWADENGVLHFRSDIYGRDEVVRRGLEAEPPGA